MSILAEALLPGAMILVVVVGVVVDGAGELDQAEAALLVEEFLEGGVDGFFFGFEAPGLDGFFEELVVDVEIGGDGTPRFRCVRVYTMDEEGIKEFRRGSEYECGASSLRTLSALSF